MRLRGRQRQHADGDVELVGEGRDLAGLAVGAEVFEDFDGVLMLELAVGAGGEGILDGLGDPEAAAVVEVDVERLMNVRLGGDELNLEAGRQMERLGLVGGSARVGVGDVWIRRGPKAEGGNEQKRNVNADAERMARRIGPSGKNRGGWYRRE